jgi:hypothetical protein
LGNPIKWFAKSSGTTNAKSKFIPVSPEEDCHYKGSKDLLCLYLNNNENSELFTGKSLRLGGSSQIHEDNNSFGLSAILIENMPTEFSSTPSNRISLMSDWETKLPLLSMIRKRKRNQFCRCPFLDVSLMNKMLEETGKETYLKFGQI